MSAETGSGARPARLGAIATNALPADGTHHFRGDIEGLRAVAVLLVILDHLFGWPAGGFIGVDVFFVISGFLITGLLLREHERTGRISFGNFYRRRVRRIIPASLLVLGVTAVVSQFLYFQSRAQEIFADVGWSLVFAANWRFASQGTDYLHANGPTSPVQHYWSLAVEEQFYVVWPLLLVGLLGLARSRAWGSRARSLTVLVAMALITVTSFGWALWDTAHNAEWAYFSTFTRTWELGVGALIAIAAGRLRGLSGQARTGLAWIGLAAILASAFVITADSGFPAPWAALPVVGAAVLIASGTGGLASVWLLTNPVARYLGALSYSLYLWHFPVIILGQAFFPELGIGYYAAAVLVTAVASAGSFHFVEQPIRRSRWLQPGGRRRERTRVSNTDRNLLVAMVCAAVLIGGGIGTAGGGGLRAPWTAAPDGTFTSASDTTTGSTGASDPQRVLNDGIESALATSEWPDLNPSLDALGENARAPEWVQDDCLDVTEENAQTCTYGDETAGKTAIVLGDSIAISWLPGIRAALPGWTVMNMTYHACPAWNVSVTDAPSGAGFVKACDDHHAWTLSEVARVKPDVVIMSSVGNGTSRLASGATGEAAEEEWAAGLAQTVELLSGSAGRVVVLQQPPGGEDLTECATRFNSPSDCDSSPSDDYSKRVSREYDAVAALGKPESAVSYVSTSSWFCSRQGKCPAFVGGTTIYADGLHITNAYAQQIAPVLQQALTPPA